MVAASYSEGETVCNPANRVMATKGTPRQILTKVRHQRAFQGSPRKSMYCLISPSLTRLHEMIENCASKIHQKAMAESTVGTTNGMSTIERRSALNRKFLLSNNAR